MRFGGASKGARARCVHCGKTRGAMRPYGAGLHIHVTCTERLKVDAARVLERGKGSEAREVAP